MQSPKFLCNIFFTSEFAARDYSREKYLTFFYLIPFQRIGINHTYAKSLWKMKDQGNHIRANKPVDHLKELFWVYSSVPYKY
jgi:hypothetical protein